MVKKAYLLIDHHAHSYFYIQPGLENKKKKPCSGRYATKKKEKKLFFTIPWRKVPLSLPAQKRECGIFSTGMVKNSIRSMGVKLASPHLVFAYTLAFRSGGNLHDI